jgi:mono/diheme cytochrome c family protein
MRRLVFVVLLAGCTGKFVRPTKPEPFPSGPEQLARGKYLVDSVAGCGACHTGRKSGLLTEPEDASAYLAGGNTDEDEGNFKIYVPNITSDPATGLGKWTDDEIARAIRDGVRKDGSLLFPAMPFQSYQHLSDADVQAIVAYLRSVPKIAQPRARFDRDIPFLAGIGMSLGMVHHEPAQNVTAPGPNDRTAYGKYLALAAHCEGCHALGGKGPKSEDDDEYLAGSDKPLSTRGVGKVWAPNLTPEPGTGIGTFKDAQLKQALRKGTRLQDGEPMLYPMSSFVAHYATMTDADLDALIAYLRTLRPVKKEVPEPQLAGAPKK